MSDFSVETRHYWRYGPHRHVMYDVLDSGTARRGWKKKKAHAVPEFYGRPRLHGEVLAWLMNEWRQRARVAAGNQRARCPAGVGCAHALSGRR